MQLEPESSRLGWQREGLGAEMEEMPCPAWRGDGCQELRGSGGVECTADSSSAQSWEKSPDPSSLAPKNQLPLPSHPS